MKAALDETSPEGPKGIFYVVGSALVIADEVTAKKYLRNVIDQPHRQRPFHWSQEGQVARTRMMDCLEDLGAVAHVCIHYPTGRRRLNAARSSGFAEIIPGMLHDGVTELCIESRGLREDERDKATILDTLNNLGASRSLTYDWYTKEEPLLWLADAICGVVGEYLLGTEDVGYFDQLQKAGVIKELIYINSNLIQEMRKSRFPS